MAADYELHAALLADALNEAQAELARLRQRLHDAVLESAGFVWRPEQQKWVQDPWLRLVGAMTAERAVEVQPDPAPYRLSIDATGDDVGNNGRVLILGRSDRTTALTLDGPRSMATVWLTRQQATDLALALLNVAQAPGGEERPRYRCNCGDEFPSHLARVAHAATCPSITPGRSTA
jgi:hypothetical protein